MRQTSLIELMWVLWDELNIEQEEFQRTQQEHLRELNQLLKKGGKQYE